MNPQNGVPQDEHLAVEQTTARDGQPYERPQLAKTQKLADVTGQPPKTGVPE
jgi:hypothetical protein